MRPLLIIALVIMILTSKSQAQFSRDQIDFFSFVFRKTFATEFIEKNLKLKFDFVWESQQINAFASLKGSTAVVHLHSGLFLHPKISLGGLTLAICHELGHFLGGAPLSGWEKWSSAEGQADYYAITQCFPRVFPLLNEWAQTHREGKESRRIVRYCRNHEKPLPWGPSFKNCWQGIIAARELLAIIATNKNQNPPEWDVKNKPSLITLRGQPPLTCRMETFRRGARHEARPSCWYIND